MLGIGDAPAVGLIPPAPAGPAAPGDRRRIDLPISHEDRALSQRTTFHGSGALAFSTKGEYGVRLMVQLGRRYGAGPASLAEISAEEALPRPYLEQLAMALREAGLVVSRRGAHGGYELARPPEAIAMADVLRALEGPLAPMICASEQDAVTHVCDRTARCTVNVLWLRIRDVIAETLDAISLADLLPARPIALESTIRTHPAVPAPSPAEPVSA